MQPKAPYETTMRLAFAEAVRQPCESKQLRRVVINKLRAGVGTRRASGWRVTRK